MATSTIKALNTVGSEINITDQDTTYFSRLAFRKIGRVVYFMSRAIKTNATISTTSGITLGTVPDNIKPIDEATHLPLWVHRKVQLRRHIPTNPLNKQM